MKSVLTALLLTLLTILLNSSVCFANQPNVFSQAQIRSGKLYLPSGNQMNDIDQVLLEAKKKGKLAIIAMGANWCHDSQSFAKKMHHHKVEPLIDKHFELLFVDVGYLDKIKDVITRFGQPVIYSTPTILVIDPVSNIQVNRSNMHLWRDAYKLSIDDTIEYFSNIADNSQTTVNEVLMAKRRNTGTLSTLNQKIEVFQRKQADRLYQAFEILGPMLEKDEQGGSVKNFRKYWRLVAKYRYQLIDDLENLKDQAVNIARSNKPGQVLKFPEYQPFEWEK